MEFPRLCRNHLIDQNFGMGITPQDMILPYYNSPGANYYRPWKWCMESGIKDFGSTIDNQREKFQITLDVQHFRPEEINVRVADKEVIIEGKHEEREDDHGFITRQFKRRYVLPSDCPRENIHSTLSSDGILTVLAKKTSKEFKDKEITVPIQMCLSCPKKEKLEFKTESAKKVDDLLKKQVEDNLNNNLDVLNNNISEMMPKEDGSRVLKPDLTKELTSMTADKILMDARKETDSLLKLATEMAQNDKISTLDKLDKVMEQSNAVKADFAEKISDKISAKMSETSNFKSTMKETLESEEISSYKSSMTSSMKVSGEQISEIISAELREAAENM